MINLDIQKEREEFFQTLHKLCVPLQKTLAELKEYAEGLDEPTLYDDEFSQEYIDGYNRARECCAASLIEILERVQS